MKPYVDLSQGDIDGYIGNGANDCVFPDCDAEIDDVTYQAAEVDENVATLWCKCKKCGRSWSNVYLLHTVKTDACWEEWKN